MAHGTMSLTLSLISMCEKIILLLHGSLKSLQMMGMSPLSSFLIEPVGFCSLSLVSVSQGCQNSKNGVILYRPLSLRPHRNEFGVMTARHVFFDLVILRAKIEE